jgi:transcription antitermination factor NusG
VSEILNEGQILPWYAIRVKSNREFGVAIGLRVRGYEQFLPTYRSQRIWSDRKKTIDFPLFPGYVFCRFDVGKRQPVVTTPGVVSILGVGRMPMPVPDEEVEAVQKVVRGGLMASPWPFLRIGDRVLIERGPLAGIEGSLIEVKKSVRLVLSIELLQRSIAAEIDKSWVRPIPSGSFRLNN